MISERVVGVSSSNVGENQGEIARPPITGVGAPRAASNPLTERGLSVTISPRPSAANTETRHDRHWFVDSTDYRGYCAACSLPERNGRHVGRVTA